MVNKFVAALIYCLMIPKVQFNFTRSAVALGRGRHLLVPNE